MTDVWTELRDERETLVDLLQSLPRRSWDAPSLCDGWRVRDVIGHLLVGTGDVSIVGGLGRLMRCGFRINRVAFQEGRMRGSAPVDDLLAAYRSKVASRSRLLIFSPEAMLAETVIHQADIRRPLGGPTQTPIPRQRRVASFVLSSWMFPSRRLTRRYRFEADDADLAVGSGRLVAGPMDALLLTLSGRSVALDELHGEGAEILRDEMRPSAKPHAPRP
jgi:uncharacterized protein (TIGR03083 family)